MRLEEFDFHLPPDQIAQHPVEPREASRMLRLERSSGAFHDAAFRDLPEFLHSGDLLVFNDTRVIPARLHGRRLGARSGPVAEPRRHAARDYLSGRVEVLLLERLEDDRWNCLVRPGRKLPVSEVLRFDPPGGSAADRPPVLTGEIVGRGERGIRQIRLQWQGDFYERLSEVGETPLPPYISRAGSPAGEARDRERYQTVYARTLGSAAAPTAGLHFNSAMLERLRAMGVQQAFINLQIGLGTFQPVDEEKIARRQLHRETYEIPTAAAAAITAARQQRRRILAVGTTALRALEACARAHAGEIVPGAGATELFLMPGDDFLAVNGLLTNFHLPRSSLLMLVSAFAGREAVLRAYRHAVHAGYRFFSYGDCMLIL